MRHDIYTANDLPVCSITTEVFFNPLRLCRYVGVISLSGVPTQLWKQIIGVHCDSQNQLTAYWMDKDVLQKKVISTEDAEKISTILPAVDTISYEIPLLKSLVQITKCLQEGCQHDVETGAFIEFLSSTYQQNKPNRCCPNCNQEILHYHPIVDEKLNQTLIENQTFWAEVYFDFNRFKDVVEKNELHTDEGQRFLELLKNSDNINSVLPKSHKSVIEIIAMTIAGRDILRMHFRIEEINGTQEFFFGQAKISAESLARQVNGKTIREWLSMPKGLELKGVRIHTLLAQWNREPAVQSAPRSPADEVVRPSSFGCL